MTPLAKEFVCHYSGKNALKSVGTNSGSSVVSLVALIGVIKIRRDEHREIQLSNSGRLITMEDRRLDETTRSNVKVSGETFRRANYDSNVRVVERVR